MKGAHVLERTQVLPGLVDEVFAFFGEPRNLEAITPPFLRFRVEGMDTPELGAETHIDYSLRLHGLPLRWRTRITEWEPPHHFVDLQLKGPYRLWHHHHSFRQVEDPDTGAPLVEVTDRVDFTVLSAAPLLRPLERAVEALFVRRDVARIFDFRTKRLAELLTP
mgnify:FL=1